MAMHSQGSGLNVNVIASKLPQFERKVIDGDPAPLRIDPEWLLSKSFPASPDLESVINEFRTFEGTWKSCFPGQSAFALAHPVFNQRGDLLFELRPHMPGQGGVSPRRANGKNGRGLWDGAGSRAHATRGMLRPYSRVYSSKHNAYRTRYTLGRRHHRRRCVSRN